MNGITVTVHSEEITNSDLKKEFDLRASYLQKAILFLDNHIPVTVVMTGNVVENKLQVRIDVVCEDSAFKKEIEKNIEVFNRWLSII